MDTQKEKTIELLARGLNAEAAAAKVGITSRTIRRWKKDPEFADELRDAIAEIRDNILFAVDPVVRLARELSEESLVRNKDLIYSDNLVDANRAMGHSHNVAIKWIKLSVALQNAETARELARAAVGVARMGLGEFRARVLDPIKQASNDAASSPSTESGRGGEVHPAASPDNCESAQKRTSAQHSVPPQPESPQSVAPDSAPPPSVSAPDTKPAAADMPGEAGKVEVVPASHSTSAASSKEAPAKRAWQVQTKSPNHVPFYANVARRRR